MHLHHCAHVKLGNGQQEYINLRAVSICQVPQVLDDAGWCPGHISALDPLNPEEEHGQDQDPPRRVTSTDTSSGRLFGTDAKGSSSCTKEA